MELEEAIQIIKEDLEHTKKANECGLATEGEFNKEIEAIETVLNELDAIKFKYQARKDRTDTIIKKQDKMIELMALALAETEFDKCCDYCHTDVCTAHDNVDERAVCIKQYFEKKVEGTNNE